MRTICIDHGFVGHRADFNTPKFPFLLIAPQRRAGTAIPASSAPAGAIAEIFFLGAVPFWAKDPSVGARSSTPRGNRRAETSFKHALLSGEVHPRRRIYEWKKEGGKKIPYCFWSEIRAPFYFAGLYESGGPTKNAGKLHDHLPAGQRNRRAVMTACPSSFRCAHALWAQSRASDPGGCSIFKPYRRRRNVTGTQHSAPENYLFCGRKTAGARFDGLIF